MIRLLVEELHCITNVADAYGFTGSETKRRYKIINVFKLSFFASSYGMNSAQALLSRYWTPRHFPPSTGLVVVRHDLRMRLLVAEMCLRLHELPVMFILRYYVMAVEKF